MLDRNWASPHRKRRRQRNRNLRLPSQLPRSLPHLNPHRSPRQRLVQSRRALPPKRSLLPSDLHHGQRLRRHLARAQRLGRSLPRQPEALRLPRLRRDRPVRLAPSARQQQPVPSHAPRSAPPSPTHAPAHPALAMPSRMAFPVDAKAAPPMPPPPRPLARKFRPRLAARSRASSNRIGPHRKAPKLNSLSRVFAFA